MKSSSFWDITPCRQLKVNRRFGGTYRLHLQDRTNRARYQRENRCQAFVWTLLPSSVLRPTLRQGTNYLVHVGPLHAQSLRVTDLGFIKDSQVLLRVESDRRQRSYLRSNIRDDEESTVLNFTVLTQHPLKLALASLTGGDRSIGIVR
jgi:hypothetical protein